MTEIRSKSSGGNVDKILASDINSFKKNIFFERIIEYFDKKLLKINLFLSLLSIKWENEYSLPVLWKEKIVMNEDWISWKFIWIESQVSGLLIESIELYQNIDSVTFLYSFITPLKDRILGLSTWETKFSDNIHYINSLIRDVNHVFSVNGMSIIKDLRNPDEKIRTSAMKMIQYQNIEERARLSMVFKNIILLDIYHSLDNFDDQVQQILIKIHYIDDPEKIDLMLTLIKKSDRKYKLLWMILYWLIFKKESKSNILYDYLKENLFVSIKQWMFAIVSLIKFLPEEMWVELFDMTVQCIIDIVDWENLKDNMLLLALVKTLPEEYRKKLDIKLEEWINKVFDNVKVDDLSKENEYIVIHAIALIESLPENRRDVFYIKSKKFIIEFINNPKDKRAFWVALFIKLFPESERECLIVEALSSTNKNMFEAALLLIPYLPIEQRKKFIILALNNWDKAIRDKVEELILFLSKADQIEVYTISPFLKQQKIITSYSGVDRALYKDSDKNMLDGMSGVKREVFDKTWSQTILLWWKLWEKIILRIVDQEAFDNWHLLFKNIEIWEQAWFDYIPIESIVSFSRIKKDFEFRWHKLYKWQFKVFTQVLDASLIELKFFKNFEKYIPELLKQKERIIWITKGFRVKHWHAHNGNFCVKFYRNKDWILDNSRCPRLYLIDFDQARM